MTTTLTPTNTPGGVGGSRASAGGGRRGWAARIEGATPVGRDRTIDAVRAVAIVGVVLGHWLVTALVADPVTGGLRAHSPLSHWPVAAPASWLFQTLGLFFFAGGYANARGVRGGYPQWMAGRLGRLLRPALVLVTAWLPVVGVLELVGAPPETVHAVRAVATDPLWFLGIYLGLTAVTPIARSLVRWCGPAVALLPLAVVAACDLARPGSFPMPVEIADTLAAWLVPYLLGVAFAEGRLGQPAEPGRPDRSGQPGGQVRAGPVSGRARARSGQVRAGLALLVGGVAGGVGLVLVVGYPASAVGVPGEGWSNLDPPSLFAMALAAAQIGLFLLVRPVLGRLLRRPPWWAPVAALNLVAMTVYCWHQSALLLVSLGGLVTGSIAGGGTAGGAGGATGVDALVRQWPGLTDAPLGAGWLGWRLTWLPVVAIVLTGLCALLHRFERPRAGGSRPARA